MNKERIAVVIWVGIFIAVILFLTSCSKEHCHEIEDKHTECTVDSRGIETCVDYYETYLVCD